MLLAHKVQLYPTAAQAEYLRRCMGARRFAYNALLAHFRQPGIKWSKRAACNYFIAHVRQPWMAELTSRAPRNAIDDLHNAFHHFFRRCKAGEKPGFPRFHKKGVHDSFAIRENRCLRPPAADRESAWPDQNAASTALVRRAVRSDSQRACRQVLCGYPGRYSGLRPTRR